jgi:hypothetical protein
MINLISKSGKLLIGMLIGVGLGFSIIGITLWATPSSPGLVAFMLGVAWF